MRGPSSSGVADLSRHYLIAEDQDGAGGDGESARRNSYHPHDQLAALLRPFNAFSY